MCTILNGIDNAHNTFSIPLEKLLDLELFAGNLVSYYVIYSQHRQNRTTRINVRFQLTTLKIGATTRVVGMVTAVSPIWPRSFPITTARA